MVAQAQLDLINQSDQKGGSRITYPSQSDENVFKFIDVIDEDIVKIQVVLLGTMATLGHSSNSLKRSFVLVLVKPPLQHKADMRRPMSSRHRRGP